MVRVAFATLVLIVLAACQSGCQSVRSWSRCPGIYSGVRYYADQISEMPFDGKVFFSVDLPLSALADTLALPATAFVDRTMPPSGYPIGCRWAAPGASG